jgi:hypothetical protein
MRNEDWFNESRSSPHFMKFARFSTVTPLLDPVLNQINPVHMLAPHFFIVNFHISLQHGPFSTSNLPFVIFYQNDVSILHRSYVLSISLFLIWSS